MKPLSSTLVSVIVAQIQNLYLVVTWPGFVGRNYVELSKVIRLCGSERPDGYGFNSTGTRDISV